MQSVSINQSIVPIGEKNYLQYPPGHLGQHSPLGGGRGSGQFGLAQSTTRQSCLQKGQHSPLRGGRGLGQTGAAHRTSRQSCLQNGQHLPFGGGRGRGQVGLAQSTSRQSGFGGSVGGLGGQIGQHWPFGGGRGYGQSGLAQRTAAQMIGGGLAHRVRVEPPTISSSNTSESFILKDNRF